MHGPCDHLNPHPKRHLYRFRQTDRLCYNRSNKGKGKVVYSSSRKRLTATGTHVSYRITQCYLPPATGDIAAFTLEAGTRFGDPEGMQGRVDLGGWLEMV